MFTGLAKNLSKIITNLYKMKIAIKTTNTELTPALRSYVEEKIGSLNRFLFKIKNVRVELGVDKNHNSGDIYSSKVMVFVPKDIIIAEERASDMYASVDLVMPKLKRQIETYVDKMRGRRKRRDKENIFSQLVDLWKPNDVLEEEEPIKIVKRKKFSISQKIAEAEAIKQMNLIGHDFYLFNNSDTDRISIIYRRNDGDYGIIEAE